MKHGREARALLRHAHSGVLSTLSLRHPGYPYGSALPCATDASGRIVVLISHLAEHTKNVQANSRASFLIAPLDPQLQQQARVTVVGDARKVHNDEPAPARYLRMLPDAARYLAIGGFDFCRIEPLQARYIAGFGAMSWIDQDDLVAAPCELDDAEEEILAHMNHDHPQALHDYCRHRHGVQARQVAMCAIDCDGFNIRADEALLRFDFSREIADPQQAREELIKLAQESRR